MVWNIFKGTSADRPAMAAVLMLAALMLLSFQDGLVKLASGATSLWQFQFLRATSNIALITLGLAYAGRLALLWPQNPKAVLIRSLVMVATMVFFFAGAPFISLAEMAAGLYTHPVFTSLLGWWVLRERFGKWRMAALVLSFIGAALLIRPWDIGFHPAQLLPICGGFTYAVNNLILRRYCRNESPVTMAAWSAAGFFAIALFGIVVLSLWQPQETATWPFLLQAWPALMGFVVAFAIVASVCNVAGNILIVKAYQSSGGSFCFQTFPMGSHLRVWLLLLRVAS